jgi:hypothetical protein
MLTMTEGVKQQIREMVRKSGQRETPTPIMALKPKELPAGRSVGPFVPCGDICVLLVVVGAIPPRAILRGEVVQAEDDKGRNARVLPGASLSVVGGEVDSQNSVHSETFTAYLPLAPPFTHLAARLTTSGPGIFGGAVLLPGGQSWDTK